MGETVSKGSKCPTCGKTGCKCKKGSNKAAAGGKNLPPWLKGK